MGAHFSINVCFGGNRYSDKLQLLTFGNELVGYTCAFKPVFGFGNPLSLSLSFSSSSSFLLSLSAFEALELNVLVRDCKLLDDKIRIHT